jgi:hypothetical protein
VLQKLRDN